MYELMKCVFLFEKKRKNQAPAPTGFAEAGGRRQLQGRLVSTWHWESDSGGDASPRSMGQISGMGQKMGQKMKNEKQNRRVTKTPPQLRPSSSEPL
jgi:hypothetical protein